MLWLRVTSAVSTAVAAMATVGAVRSASEAVREGASEAGLP